MTRNVTSFYVCTSVVWVVHQLFEVLLKKFLVLIASTFVCLQAKNGPKHFYSNFKIYSQSYKMALTYGQQSEPKIKSRMHVGVEEKISELTALIYRPESFDFELINLNLDNNTKYV